MSTLAFNHPRGHLAKPRAVALTACQCCGARHHAPVASKRGYPLRRCSECGVVFVSPMPNAAELDALYRSAAGYFATAQTDLTKIPSSSALWLDNALIQHGIASGRFLDVGCANGALIHSMRGLGWNVFGVDVNTDAIAIARRHDLNVVAGTLESAKFADSSFDVVYLGDVIEHVTSPRQIIDEIHRILRPRGIVAMRTPNAHCGFASLTLLAARTLHCSWAHSEAPYHLHEFTRRSLATLLRNAGFQIAFNRAEGRSRFSYKLGATGLFDDLKRRLKSVGGYRLNASLLPHLPLIALAAMGIAPAFLAGRAWDLCTGGGDAIFIGAKKL